jgi:hypothetical protein
VGGVLFLYHFEFALRENPPHTVDRIWATLRAYLEERGSSTG